MNESGRTPLRQTVLVTLLAAPVIIAIIIFYLPPAEPRQGKRRALVASLTPCVTVEKLQAEKSFCKRHCHIGGFRSGTRACQDLDMQYALVKISFTIRSQDAGLTSEVDSCGGDHDGEDHGEADADEPPPLRAARARSLSR